MNIANHLLTHDIKPSYQRIKIFEYLYSEMNHPTVDVIYKNLVDNIPTLSKTTVYNTLKLFVDKGITSTVTIEDNEVRYDAIVDNHGHFKCDDCGHIYDIEIDFSSLLYNELENFKIDETHIHLKGKCNKCLTK
ncbi:MAG: transcriptional repressor [Flavobacteriales bacterium]|nr:transcriptional repressor [Flavobacteriales bacterium]MCB9363552.1 transcriptional repressor [Flavobacteriales bacterium]